MEVLGRAGVEETGKMKEVNEMKLIERLTWTDHRVRERIRRFVGMEPLVSADMTNDLAINPYVWMVRIQKTDGGGLP